MGKAFILMILAAGQPDGGVPLATYDGYLQCLGVKHVILKNARSMHPELELACVQADLSPPFEPDDEPEEDPFEKK